MRVEWIKNNKTYDITEFISSIVWSGSASQASRTLEITVVYSPYDENIDDLSIGMGDWLKLYAEGDVLLIHAMVYTRSRVSEQGTISYTAYDDLNRLLKSNGTYNFKNTTPEKITKKVCSDLQIDVGGLAKTDVTIKSMLVDSESYYNIIMKAYTKDSKISRKKYIIMMYDKKLFVIEKGEIISDFYLSDTANITSSSYSESLDSVVNKVRIYNDKSKQEGEAINEESIARYGIFQTTYTKEDGVNAVIAARNMLTGIEKEASIEALGNIKCISGYGIIIKDSVTGLDGKFWIDGDTHTWADGKYTMSLDLVFKNIMDTQEE